MNRIDKKFKELKRKNRKAFIAYVTAGDPDLDMTEKLVIALEGTGVDIIELGIPFSDPLADGPTIQAASQRALKKGASLDKIFRKMKNIRAKTDLPIAFMTYYNPVLRHGLEKFVNDCRSSGVDGVIIPDLPCEEAKDMIRLAKKKGVATIFLVAPTSTKERIKKIADSSTGFIYYVSLTGVTGARKTLPADMPQKIRQIRSLTRKPLAAGFGISDPAQAKAVARIADGVIVGSAIVKVIEKNSGKASLPDVVSKFAKKIAGAIHEK